MHSVPCPYCGQLYETMSWQPCHCDTARFGGHRTYPCRACGRARYDPPCATPERDSSYGAR